MNWRKNAKKIWPDVVPTDHLNQEVILVLEKLPSEPNEASIEAAKKFMEEVSNKIVEEQVEKVAEFMKELPPLHIEIPEEKKPNKSTKQKEAKLPKGEPK